MLKTQNNLFNLTKYVIFITNVFNIISRQKQRFVLENYESANKHFLLKIVNILVEITIKYI